MKSIPCFLIFVLRFISSHSKFIYYCSYNLSIRQVLLFYIIDVLKAESRRSCAEQVILIFLDNSIIQGVPSGLYKRNFMLSALPGISAKPTTTLASRESILLGILRWTCSNSFGHSGILPFGNFLLDGDHIDLMPPIISKVEPVAKGLIHFQS